MVYVISTDMTWVQSVSLRSDDSAGGETVKGSFKDIVLEHNDILLVDGRVVSPDSLHGFLRGDGSGYDSTCKVFYLAGSSIDFYYAKSLFKDDSGVHVFSDSLGLSAFRKSVVQSIDKSAAFKPSNVICFSGASRGVGCTSVSSALSKMLASDVSLKVLHISLDGTEGVEYLTRNAESGIDEIKSKLLTGVVSQNEIIEVCTEVAPNFFVLKGTALVPFARQFTPKAIERLLSEVSPLFDVVVCDVGSDYTLGSALSVLNSTTHRFVVLSQAPVSLKRFGNSLEQVLEPLGISKFYAVVNSYRDADGFVEPVKITEELKVPIVAQIPLVQNAILCEVKGVTLNEIGASGVEPEIMKLVSMVSTIIGRSVTPVASKRRGLFGK